MAGIDIKTVGEISKIIQEYAQNRNDVIITEVDLYWTEVPKQTECTMWMPDFPAPRVPRLIPEPELKPFLKIKLQRTW